VGGGGGSSFLVFYSHPTHHMDTQLKIPLFGMILSMDRGALKVIWSTAQVNDDDMEREMCMFRISKPDINHYL
jgi:hypothetical protein